MAKRVRAKAVRTREKAPVLPFGRLPEAVLGALRERLAAAGYAEPAVATRLGVPHPAAISLDRYPIYEERLRGPGAATGDGEGSRDPLGTAIGLFLLQGDATREEAEALLGHDLFGKLVDG